MMTDESSPDVVAHRAKAMDVEVYPHVEVKKVTEPPPVVEAVGTKKDLVDGSSQKLASAVAKTLGVSVADEKK